MENNEEKVIQITAQELELYDAETEGLTSRYRALSQMRSSRADSIDLDALTTMLTLKELIKSRELQRKLFVVAEQIQSDVITVGTMFDATVTDLFGTDTDTYCLVGSMNAPQQPGIINITVESKIGAAAKDKTEGQDFFYMIDGYENKGTVLKIHNNREAGNQR